MFVNSSYPALPSRFGIERVDITSSVAEVHQDRRPSFLRPDSNGGAYATSRAKNPSDATGLRVEGIHGPILTSHKNSATGDSGLRPSDGRIRKSKRPTEFQPRHIGQRQPRLIGRL
jgi:hypothetical protein